jgi:hypothetical protein
VPYGQAEAGQQLGRTGTLDGEHGERLVLVGDRDAGRGPFGQAAGHLGGVGRVRDEQHVVVAVPVGDEVVDHTPTLVAAQRVLGLPGADAVEVPGQAAVEEGGGARAAHADLAQVRHVEDAGGGPDRRVLAQHAAPGVLQRHEPAAELGELRAGRLVPGVQWRAPGGPGRGRGHDKGNYRRVWPRARRRGR